MNLDGCTALITGASAGIGREFAQQLAARAGKLILVARREQRLQELRDKLIAEYPALEVDTRQVDLANPSDLSGLTDWLSQDGAGIDLLINNAGLGDIGGFDTADPSRLEQMILVNICSLTLLCRAALPSMIARKKGAILNVSSSAGFLPIPGFAVYAASKAYVTSFTEALRAEVAGSGITITALCPGPVPTEFTDVAYRPGMKRPVSPRFVQVSAEQVAQAALEAIEHDRPIVIPGGVMKLAMTFTRLTPMAILRLFWRLGANRITLPKTKAAVVRPPL